MSPEEVRRQILAAIDRGEIPMGGPSEICAYGLADEVPRDYWEGWSADATARIRAKAEHPRCCCGPFSEPGRDGRCERCCGWPT
jgi:hypothetical protein